MSIRNARLPALTVLAALIATSSLHAATIKVPLQQPTISDAIAAANDGDKIVVSKGVYVEALDLTARANLTIKGKGKVIVDADGEDNALRLGFCEGVKVSNLIFRNAVEALVLVQFGTDNRIEDCRFEGSEAGQEDGIRIEGGNGTEVTNSRFVNIQRHGADIDSTATYIGDCEFIHCGQGSEFPVMRLYGNHLTIEKNKIEDDGQGMGIFLGQNGKNSLNALVRKNKIVGVGMDAIQMVNVLDSLVVGNVIKGSFFDGIDLQAGSDGNTIKKNRISGSGDIGIEVSSDHNQVCKNRIKKSGATGIAIYGPSESCNWIKNRIRSSGAAGFFVFGVDHVFKKNNVKGSSTFDLQDETPPDSNKYVQNAFGTTN